MKNNIDNKNEEAVVQFLILSYTSHVAYSIGLLDPPFY